MRSFFLERDFGLYEKGSTHEVVRGTRIDEDPRWFVGYPPLQGYQVVLLLVLNGPG